MRHPSLRSLILSALAASSAGAARAAEVACWFDAGALVVPAVVADVAGDYILDTGAATTQLDETRAQGAGLEGEKVTGGVTLAGIALPPGSISIAPLDVRAWNLPTALAGVIGADVLRGVVLDVTYAPCRVRLSPAGRAPVFKARRRLDLVWDAGRPTTQALAWDGRRAVRGPFVVATGANVAVRLTDDIALAPGAGNPVELYPQGVWLARLPGFSFAGSDADNLGAGLMKPDGAVAGVIGAPALARYRLRFDFPAGKLLVSPLGRSR